MMDMLSAFDLILAVWVGIVLIGFLRYYKTKRKPSGGGVPTALMPHKEEMAGVFWLLVANLVLPIFLKLFSVLLHNFEAPYALAGSLAGMLCLVGFLMCVYIRRRQKKVSGK